MAFLSFQDAVDKELILQNAPHVIGGYEVTCDDAKPKSSDRPTYNYYDWGEWGSDSVSRIFGTRGEFFILTVRGQYRSIRVRLSAR